MTAKDFERARSAEAKHGRRAAILESAVRLATERGVRDVTLTDIAAGVGMHKSTMLRYFETREDIFLNLVADGWSDWSSAVRDRLAALEKPVDASDAAWAAEPVARVLAETLVARPLFCDLVAHTPLNLERGVSFATVRAFKAKAVAAAETVVEALRSILPLEQSSALNTVTTATALAGALWQMAAPGTELRRFYESEPALAHTIVDVEPKLVDVLTALLRGYLAS